MSVLTNRSGASAEYEYCILHSGHNNFKPYILLRGPVSDKWARCTEGPARTRGGMGSGATTPERHGALCKIEPAVTCARGPEILYSTLPNIPWCHPVVFTYLFSDSSSPLHTQLRGFRQKRIKLPSRLHRVCLLRLIYFVLLP